MKISEIKEKASFIGALEKELAIVLKSFEKKEALVVCDYFNGQPYGSSKPKLKGKILTIQYALYQTGKIYLGFNGTDSVLELDKVSII